MTITLIWRDKNWKERGYAKNLWLKIHTDKKTYDKYETYTTAHGEGIAEVTRKSDITNMVAYLKNQGYKSA